MFKNNSYDKRCIKSSIKNNNQKRKIFEKYIIENNKLKLLYKFIKIEKPKSNTNIKTQKIKCIKELDNTIYNSSNKNMNYIFNINNTYVSYINNMPKEEIRQKSLEKNVINNIYINDKNNLESKTKYSKNDWYCFPDNKLRKIKGLSKESKKLLKYVNIKNKKQMNKRYLDAAKINNYFTYMSNYIKTIEDNQNVSTERSRFNNKNKSIDEKNNHEYIMKKNLVHQWVLFPIKIEKFIRRIIIINNGYLFFDNLNKINIKKIIIIKRNKLLAILKNINKKILKYYFRIYRDNVLIEKVKLIYQKNFTITRLRSKSKKSHNIQNKAKLFITKASNNNLNHNKNNCLKNYEKFLDRIKSLIYKYHITDDFIILTRNLMSNNFFFENKINSNNTIDTEIKQHKKHLKVKYIRKTSCKTIGKNNFTLSDKTTSSNLSKSTISPTKKMKVYKRIVCINNNEITEKIRRQFELKMTYIISKICTKEKIKFSEWKKLIFN